MKTLDLPPWQGRCWNGTIDCGTENASLMLMAHYQVAQEKSVDLVKIECTLADSAEKVTIIIRNNFRGLFGDKFKKNGILEFDSDLGHKTKYHIKAKTSCMASAYPLLLPFIICLKKKNFIQHSLTCIVETAPDSAIKSKMIMSLKYTGVGDEEVVSAVHLNQVLKI